MNTFDDLLGHEGPLTILRKQVQGEQPAHALLLVGPEGIGKRLSALIAATTYLCGDPAEAGPCGRCDACRRMKAGSHHGFSLIDPEYALKDRDPEDPEPIGGVIPGLYEDSSGAGRIGIDPIRALRSDLALKPAGDQRRAMILADFHLATREAQNALLKTLEEPPDQTLLLVTSASEKELPRTIVSRCQTIRFQPLSVNQVESILEEQLEVDTGERTFLARLSGGRPGTAIRHADENLIEKRDWLVERIQEYGTLNDPRFRKDLISRLSNKKGGAAKRKEFKRYLLLLATLLREALYAKLVVGEEHTFCFPDDVLATYTENRDIPQILEAAETIDLLDEARERFVNEKIMVENLQL